MAVLDKLSGGIPSVAYGLRLLTTTYSGPAINVWRSSDNTTMNIGFVNGQLDTATLLAFVGSGSGYVATWYNQGTLGSAGNCTQFSPSFDPRIVNAGVLSTFNGRATLDFSENTASFLNLPAANSPAGMTQAAFNIVGSYKPNGTSSIIPYMVGSGNNGSTAAISFNYNGGSPNVNVFILGTLNGATYPITTGQPYIFTSALDSTLRQYVNGVNVSTNTGSFSLSGWATGQPRLGQNFGSPYWQGLMAEVVQTTKALPLSDQLILETNQAAFYNLSYPSWPALASKSTSYARSTIFSGDVRVSQADLQLLGIGTPNLRVSQADLQLLGIGTPNLRVSQADLQVLWSPPFQLPQVVSFIASR